VSYLAGPFSIGKLELDADPAIGHYRSLMTYQTQSDLTSSGASRQKLNLSALQDIALTVLLMGNSIDYPSELGELGVVKWTNMKITSTLILTLTLTLTIRREGSCEMDEHENNPQRRIECSVEDELARDS
jgi:hypothetical protein